MQKLETKTLPYQNNNNNNNYTGKEGTKSSQGLTLCLGKCLNIHSLFL